MINITSLASASSIYDATYDVPLKYTVSAGDKFGYKEVSEQTEYLYRPYETLIADAVVYSEETDTYIEIQGWEEDIKYYNDLDDTMYEIKITNGISINSVFYTDDVDFFPDMIDYMRFNIDESLLDYDINSGSTTVNISINVGELEVLQNNKEVETKQYIIQVNASMYNDTSDTYYIKYEKYLNNTNDPDYKSMDDFTFDDYYGYDVNNSIVKLFQPIYFYPITTNMRDLFVSDVVSYYMPIMLELIFAFSTIGSTMDDPTFEMINSSSGTYNKGIGFKSLSANFTNFDEDINYTFVVSADLEVNKNLQGTMTKTTLHAIVEKTMYDAITGEYIGTYYSDVDAVITLEYDSIIWVLYLYIGLAVAGVVVIALLVRAKLMCRGTNPKGSFMCKDKQRAYKDSQKMVNIEIAK